MTYSENFMTTGAPATLRILLPPLGSPLSSGSHPSIPLFRGNLAWYSVGGGRGTHDMTPCGVAMSAFSVSSPHPLKDLKMKPPNGPGVFPL